MENVCEECEENDWSQERADLRFSVVFDLDETLTWYNRDRESFILRPNVKEILTELRKKDIKIVLWTSSTKRV